MNDRLAHRGPDGSGIWSAPGVAFGHRRLAIIDLGPTGAQPMCDRRGFVITYNGELYNFGDLRKELEAVGEQFLTRSDTEVVLKAYIRWQEQCLHRFNGMFAFAIADLAAREVFIARDRIGVKPLYYAQLGRAVLFASELGALLSSGELDGDIELARIPSYLSTGYFPAEHTPFRNVRLLKAGHFARIRRGVAAERRYWDPAAAVDKIGGTRLGDRDEEELRALIEDSVLKETVADVPVGVFLSGGLDSSVVAATLARRGGARVKTITVSVPDDPLVDEGPLARQVAARYDTEHHEIQVSASDMMTRWDALLDRYDQPFSDLSSLPTFLASEFARTRVKVVLSGDGGDEQWGGYGNYRRYRQLLQIRRCAPGRALRRAVGALSSGVGRVTAMAAPLLGDRLAYYGSVLATPDSQLFSALNRHARDELLRALAGDRLAPHLNLRFSGPESACDPNLGVDGAMLHDLQYSLVDQVLRKVDTMSMTVGLEVRVPLLDHRLVEKSIQISSKDKVDANVTKRLIRRMFSADLPADVVSGAKRGFEVPADSWFRGPLKPLAHDTLLSISARQRGILNPGTVELVLGQHQSGRAQHGRLIACLIALERWCCRYD